MKGRMMKWLARGAFVTLVAGAMLVASPQYAAAGNCDEEWQAGSCPPLTPGPEGTCYSACQLKGFPDGGTCGPGPCCNCFL